MHTDLSAERDVAADGPIVVVGEFDGFHVGHRRLFCVAGEMARDHRRSIAAVVVDDCGRARLTMPEETARACLRAGASSAHVIALPSSRDDDGGSPDELVTTIVRRCGP